MTATPRPFGWPEVVRLGLVQAAIGAVVVLMTSTLNRVMVVELALPAAVPGGLVALHFAVQCFFRPRMGHRSDAGGRRSGTILTGMAILGLGGTGATAAVALMSSHLAVGLVTATLAFAAIGVGVSAAGTPLLALLADRVTPERRGRAAAIVWLMMIAGFVLTTVVVGRLIEPFTFLRMVRVAAGVGLVAFLLSLAALYRLEGPGAQRATSATGAGFGGALRLAWREPATRRFALFVFVAMLGYSAQDLILEPFAGGVFGLTPGESTRIGSVHQGAMLAGMLLAGALAVRFGGLVRWAAGGCVASGLACLALAVSPGLGGLPALRASLVALGIANGAFAIGAIGSMMVRARGASAGLRMGIFGAAQAVAYAIGGFLGAAGSDLARAALGSSAEGYAVVFVVEGVLFGVAALLVTRDPEGGDDRLHLGTADDGHALLAAVS